MNLAEQIIEKFGGLAKMSARMSHVLGGPVPKTTIQYWGVVGHVPAGRQPDVLKAAAFHDEKYQVIELGPADFFEIVAATPIAGFEHFE